MAAVEIEGNDGSKKSVVLSAVEAQLLLDAPPDVRANFVRKVLLIVAVQLGVTSIIAGITVYNAKALWSQRELTFVGVIVLSIMTLGFLFSLTCCCGCQKNARTYPLNFILLAGFTICWSPLIGITCSTYEMHSIIMSLAITSGMVVALFLYAVCTKTDFTTCGPYLFMFALGLMSFGIFSKLVGCAILESVGNVVGVIVMSFYIIYDVQVIVGNHALALSVDDYVFGAVSLYVDIVQLFLRILEAVGERK